MCGIVGFIDPVGDEESAGAVLTAMMDQIAHRGPDHAGTYIDGALAIGHRRLAVVDLSPLGNQPMKSMSGRYVIAFNGEIYNHSRLRSAVEARGVRFLGHSDTEVLLGLIEVYGIHSALQKCIGMFAFALWDRQSRRLYLARDRFGEKPLYYGFHGGTFLFGSELKALTANDCFEKNVDRNAVADLVRCGYIQSPRSIYQKTFKVRPGAIVTVGCPALGRPFAGAGTIEEEIYWSHEAVFIEGTDRPFRGRYLEAIEELRNLLLDAVSLQMQADVSLGAFLSGGVDSSIVVAIMQSISPKPIRTYSVGFEAEEFNEARYAKAVARYLGTDHTEIYIGVEDALSVIPLLPRMYDEPLGDVSQIPTHIVARLARMAVTVALSGDGGDEIFGGYSKYSLGQRFANFRYRSILGAIVGSLPWKPLEVGTTLLPARIGRRINVRNLTKLHRILTAREYRGIARAVATLCCNESDFVLTPSNGESSFDQQRTSRLEESYERLSMLLDREGYLPDGVLTKVDRATMAVSLEGRAPLLDHRIAEFAAALPLNFIVDQTGGKRILRDLLGQYVPRSLVERPKAGFGVPVGEWLCEGLNSWARDLLASKKSEEFLNLNACVALFDEHCRGQGDHGLVLWAILGFIAWAEEWL